MTKRMRFTLVVALLAVIPTACGGSHYAADPGPLGTGASPVPTRVVVGQILGFEINPMTYGVSVQTSTMPSDGVLDAVVPYAPFPGAHVQVFLFNNQNEERACFPNTTSMANCPDALARGVDPTQMPQTLRFRVAPGQSYRVNVRNRGPAVATNGGQLVEVGFTPDR
jgi:hypothetical protein